MVFLLCGAMLLGSAALALAQSRTEVEAQIQQNTSQIRDLEEEIRQLQRQLDETSRQKQTLQNAIRALDLNIQKLTASISLTQAEIRQKDREIADLGGNIQTTGERIGAARGQIGNSLRELNNLDRQPLAAVLLGGATLSKFFDEAVSQATVREGLQERIVVLSSLKSDLEVDKSEAEKKRTELAALQSRLAGEKRGLDVAKAEEQKLLKQTQNQESQYQALIAQKQAEKNAFEAALVELASQLDYILDPGRIPPAGKGILRWPLDNVHITQHFGNTAFAQSGAYSGQGHNGIDFRAAIGTPVKAALTGVVMEVNHGAVQNCQYGKWVLIKHSNGLATLYAHLSDIAVAKGETVPTGKVVGYAGATGYATGPHLHFTVYAAEAVSLKQYKCLSGYTVTVPIVPLNGYLNPISYL
jgi:murein DD-endopeptidase MepM/ murein hydrolase activator NlpD